MNSKTYPPAEAANAQPQAALALPNTEVLRLLQARGSVRRSKPDPVPDAWVEAILAPCQRAPTSSNIQTLGLDDDGLLVGLLYGKSGM